MNKENFLLPKKIISSIILIIAYKTAFNQCVTTVSSTNGYDVDVIVTLTDIAAPAICPFGYNYNVELDYDVSFSGANIPGSLFTLQANIHCGSDNLFFNIPNSPGSGSLTTTANPYNNNTDCNTATLSSLGCNDITLQINGPGIPNQFILIDCNVLPIKLIRFNAEINSNNVELFWSTASEINNDFFTLEKSKDGINWSAFAEQPGAGNSNTILNYKGLDYNPYQGVSYYRLKQTDFDGKFEYSNIISIKNINKSSISISPNPFNYQLIVDGISSKNIIKIYSADGKLIFKGNTKKINTQKWNKGIYNVVIIDNNNAKATTFKIVK